MIPELFNLNILLILLLLIEMSLSNSVNRSGWVWPWDYFTKPKPPEQSIDIAGYLHCNGKPLNDVYLKLIDEDKYFSDEMAKSLTSSTGFFILRGKASDDDGQIDPILTFEHECIIKSKPRMFCHLQTKVRLHPHLYVDKGLIDIGIFEIADYPAATQEICSWMRWFIPD